MCILNIEVFTSEKKVKLNHLVVSIWLNKTSNFGPQGFKNPGEAIVMIIDKSRNYFFNLLHAQLPRYSTTKYKKFNDSTYFGWFFGLLCCSLCYVSSIYLVYLILQYLFTVVFSSFFGICCISTFIKLSFANKALSKAMFWRKKRSFGL